jgi:hypothetical protein
MGDKGKTILGLVVIAAGLAGVVYIIHKTINAISPAPAAVQPALSAYFDGGNLAVKGEVLQGAQPLTKGKVKLIVSNLRGNFEQSAFVDVKSDGTFGAGAAEIPAFGVLRPNDPIKISAEVQPGGTSQVYTDTIYLNINPPTQFTRPMIALLVFGTVAFFISVVVFFWAFTGPPSLTKDRAAIILSYCVLIAFLALPIGLGIVLGSGLGPDSMYTAVGLLITKIPQKDATQPSEAQWAFNIGGFVSPLPAPQAVAAAVSSQPAIVTTSQVSNGTASPSTAPPIDSGPSGTPTKAPTVSQAPGTRSTQSSAAPPDPPGPGAARDPTQLPVALHPWQAQEVHVDGGLVIPLYVIILSVIGGAINMTRRVPTIQGQAPEEYPSFVRRIRKYFQIAQDPSGITTTTTSRSVEMTEQVKLPAQTDSSAVVPQTAGVANIEPAVETESPHEPAAAWSNEDGMKSSPVLAGDQSGTHTKAWRVNLLSLYMYLLSAPFLAIVTYYLLWWLDLTKVPILVLVSFSIGLMSDQIVTKILSVVQGWLNNEDSGASGAQMPALSK